MNTAWLVRTRTVLLWAMLGSVLAFVGMISLWIMVEDTFAEFFTFGLLMLAGFAFSALLCVNLLCRSRYVPLMWIGVGSSVLAFLIWQPVSAIEWWRFNINETGYIFAGTLSTVIAGWCALFAALHTSRPANALAVVINIITLVLGAFIGMSTVIAVMIEPRDDTFWGLLIIASLLGGVGVVASMAITQMAKVRAAGAGETIGGKVFIELVCPRCRSRQSLRTGLSRCQSCGLRMELNIEEPVCDCGYQLYQLTSDRCPECGREIPHEDRWGVHDTVPPPSEGGG